MADAADYLLVFFITGLKGFAGQKKASTAEASLG